MVCQMDDKQKCSQKILLWGREVSEKALARTFLSLNADRSSRILKMPFDIVRDYRRIAVLVPYRRAWMRFHVESLH